MAKITTKLTEGELFGLLTRMGFTSAPNVLIFAPGEDLTVARMQSYTKKMRPTTQVNDSTLTITEVHENTRGVRGARDFYGVGTIDGKQHRFYLVNRGNGYFIDGYLQKITPSLPGPITLEEYDH